MKPSSTREPYYPPRITRVVLRSEQAILSQCSGGMTGAVDASGANCVNLSCRRNFAPGDSTGVS